MDMTHRGVIRTPGRARHRAILGILSAALVCLACATPTSENDERGLSPAGPGAVFPSVQAAAVDALAWSHLRSAQLQYRGRIQGGAIHAVPGGFSYDLPMVATDSDPDVVRYQLEPGDVAHFRLNTPGMDPRANRDRERFTRRDRSTVNEHDPAHRPLYILTPKLAVRAYHGSSVGSLDVAHLDPKRSSGSETVYLVELD